MTTSVEPVRPGPLEPMPPAGFESREEARELAASWRTLTRAATFVAILTCPALVVFFMHQNDWPFWKSLLISLTIVIVFRGFVDLVLRRTIPSPSLFGLEADVHREEDVLARRRVWFWRFWFKIGATVAIVVTIVWLFQGDSWTDAAASIWDGILNVLSSPSLWIQVVFVFFLFIANFAILMGPLLLMNLAQMQAFEPGDAQWGVKLGDVRGQAEAKEEVRRVVSIWQSGEAFERAGGKRERGLLFLGAPGTGKTMLAKAIATGFNSPFISMPGSGFAATFIGIDAIVVRILARRAKKLARKWGGQCIVFIDEIDAVGRRRQALQSSMPLDINSYVDPSDFCFFGPWGARNPSGDVIVESARWRERLFEQRAPQRLPNPLAARIGNLVNQFPGGMFGGMGGGQLALNQLLVVMDGIDNPPFMRRVLTSRVNTLLDASYVIPRRIRKIRLRIPAAPPARRTDLLHRRDQRPARRARPGIDTPWPHGPPRPVPHADEGRPQGRLRPLPRQGGARRRSRHAQAARRDRADHERLLAGDDRPDLLDGADQRPARGPDRVLVGASRPVDDHARGRQRRQHQLRRGRAAGDGDPRGRTRDDGARLPARARVQPVVDPHARTLARPPPGLPAGGALQRLAARAARRPDPRSRRDGRGERLLRREHERRRRRPAERDRGGRVDGRDLRHAARARRAEARWPRTRPRTRRARGS